MLIKFLFATFLALLAGVANATEVQISLLDVYGAEQSNYSMDLKELNAHRISKIEGTLLPQIDIYSSINRKLAMGSKELAEADEILYQCQIDELDLIVVRDEYNSFFGPLRLLSALSGHPIQVSRIVVLTIRNGVILADKEITRKDSAYKWQVGIFR